MNIASTFGSLAGKLLAAVALFICFSQPSAAQNQQTAQLAVQIQEMQEQIRLLTGQVEGLQFLVTQMQAQLATMTEDNEFRFQALEGGAGKKPAAATDTGPAPDQQLPQTQASTLDAPLDLNAPTDLNAPGMGEPMELDLGDSQDPLVGNANGQSDLGSLSEEDAVSLGGGRPLDLSLDGGATVSDGDANAQYQAGYDAIVRGDYAFAQEQFSQFVAIYPDDPQGADATNWLGEAMIQQGAYDDAALVLAEGYKKYQNDKRAPDLMLKLGIALVGSQQQELACRTFFTLKARYTNLTPAFTQRLEEEKSKAQCPV